MIAPNRHHFPYMKKKTNLVSWKHCHGCAPNQSIIFLMNKYRHTWCWAVSSCVSRVLVSKLSPSYVNMDLGRFLNDMCRELALTLQIRMVNPLMLNKEVMAYSSSKSIFFKIKVFKWILSDLRIGNMSVLTLTC